MQPVFGKVLDGPPGGCDLAGEGEGDGVCGGVVGGAVLLEPHEVAGGGVARVPGAEHDAGPYGAGLPAPVADGVDDGAGGQGGGGRGHGGWSSSVSWVGMGRRAGVAL